MPRNVSTTRIICIIILYWPDEDTVEFIVNLAQKGWSIVAVVNGIRPAINVKLNLSGIFKIINNERNVGLSRALNQGCQFAFKEGASHVFLLDQDSRPEGTLPKELLTDWQAAEKMGKSVGIIAPVLIDVKHTGNKTGHKKNSADLSIVSNAETLATSGSLISKTSFQLVGGMYEWLFIDGIDHEWCFRARQHKLAILRSNNRAMLHNMGDHGITLFGRYRPIHRSPMRHRYIVRNTMFMIRQPYVDWRWRLREAIKTFYRIPIYIAVSTDRKSTIYEIVTGLTHGLLHRREPKIG